MSFYTPWASVWAKTPILTWVDYCGQRWGEYRLYADGAPTEHRVFETNNGTGWRHSWFERGQRRYDAKQGYESLHDAKREAEKMFHANQNQEA